MIGKNKVNIVDEATINRVNQDLIVHNMPNQIFMSHPSTKNTSSQLNNSSDKKHNFKMVGAIIVGLGIIFVGALIYLSYYFIIKPKTKPALSIQVPVMEGTNTVASEDFDKISTSSEVVATSTVIVESAENPLVNIDLTASSTASSTFLTNEEEILIDLPPLLDTDSDGLFDGEETIFGSNYLLVDTDSDNYQDLSEIKNGYSPLMVGKKLYPNDNWSEYEDKIGMFSMSYPREWEARSLNNGYTTMISMPDNSLIQVSVSQNTNIQDILTWYGATFSDEIVSADRLVNSETWEGIAGDDNLNFYLTDKERKNIFIVSYIPSISGRVAYPNVYQAIIQSFQLSR